jgi:hypothetical protein
MCIPIWLLVAVGLPLVALAYVGAMFLLAARPWESF